MIFDPGSGRVVCDPQSLTEMSEVVRQYFLQNYSRFYAQGSEVVSSWQFRGIF